MSDYLASLVAKALNRTEAVQPRLASRFEPPQETSDAMPSERFRLETTDDERVADASAGSPVETIQRSPHRAEASRSAPSQAELALDESRPEAPTGAATTSDRQSVRQPASPRVTAQASDTEPLRHASSLVLEPARDVSSAMPNVPLEATAYTAQHASPPPRMGPSASSLRDERTGVTRPRGDDDRSRPPTPEPERQASVVEAVEGRQDAPSPPITASSRIRSRRSSAPPQVVAQPQVTSSREPSASLPVERMTAPDAGPTIRVHIGRVEVRAILPPAPAAPRPKPAHRAPALSLDEYLKQRQGGATMSTALAIASVTAVLKDLLNNGIVDHDLATTVGNVAVTSLPPDRIDTTNQNQQSQLNLFMYRVTPNQGWRNAGLPSRNQNGERLSNPPLALNLHYLLSAYGANELHHEILLGYGMQILHETPVLTRDAIRTALAPPTPVSAGNLPPELQALSTSELAEQVEQIKITPESLSTEEMSRLWAAFQSHYRPTAMYQVSVVLIESRRSTKAALPVRARNLYVVPFRHPVIEQLRDLAGVNQPIVADSTLVIEGQRLRGDVTRVRIGEIEVEPVPEEVSDTRIMIPLAPLAITSPPLLSPPLSSTALRAGVQGVQVIHQLLMGTPPVPHRGVESNVAAFVLRPTLTAVGVANVQGSGAALRSAEVTVHVEPTVGQSQRVVLLLNQRLREAPAAYTFLAATRNVDSNQITLPISGVRAGEYLVRVQVDGAESPLEVGPALTSPPTADQFTGPQVTIP